MVGCQKLDVDVVADMAMRPPSPFGHTPLMMSREMTSFSHKAKRVLLSHPGKPLRCIWLKREQAVFGTDHHIAPLLAILHARDDMNRLLRRFRFGLHRGRAPRTGNRGRGLLWTLDRAGRLSRSYRVRALLEQAGEISDLLLQGGNLGLQSGKLLWK